MPSVKHLSECPRMRTSMTGKFLTLPGTKVLSNFETVTPHNLLDESSLKQERPLGIVY